MKKKTQKKEGILRRFKKFLIKISKGKLFKNKLYSLYCELLALASLFILKDLTIYIIFQGMSLMLFFAKENYIDD